MSTSSPFSLSQHLELSHELLELSASLGVPFSQEWSLVNFNSVVTPSNVWPLTTPGENLVATGAEPENFVVPFFSGLPQVQVTGLVLAQEELPPVETVDYVDLTRYDGLWYEVARTTNFFQIGCVSTTATYGLLSESSVSVLNACYNVFSGQDEAIAGVATVVDPQTNAKLKVSFDGVPTSGDYWIIDLVENTPGGDYTYAVVGEPSRNFVFILSRTPRANPLVLDQLYANLEAQYYDVSKIRRSLQPPQFMDELTAGGNGNLTGNNPRQTDIFATDPLQPLTPVPQLAQSNDSPSWVGSVNLGQQFPGEAGLPSQSMPLLGGEGLTLG